MQTNNILNHATISFKEMGNASRGTVGYKSLLIEEPMIIWTDYITEDEGDQTRSLGILYRKGSQYIWHCDDDYGYDYSQPMFDLVTQEKFVTVKDEYIDFSERIVLLETEEGDYLELTLGYFKHRVFGHMTGNVVLGPNFNYKRLWDDDDLRMADHDVFSTIYRIIEGLGSRVRVGLLPLA